MQTLYVYSFNSHCDLHLFAVFNLSGFCFVVLEKQLLCRLVLRNNSVQFGLTAPIKII